MLMLNIVDRIEAVGAKFRSLTESIDTSTPAGEMVKRTLWPYARDDISEAHTHGMLPEVGP